MDKMHQIHGLYLKRILQGQGQFKSKKIKMVLNPQYGNSANLPTNNSLGIDSKAKTSSQIIQILQFTFGEGLIRRTVHPLPELTRKK